MKDTFMDRKSSPIVTAEMAGKIKFMKLKMGLFNHQIAAFFGINQGRVSEVMTGKRYPEVGPIAI